MTELVVIAILAMVAIFVLLVSTCSILQSVSRERLEWVAEKRSWEDERRMLVNRVIARHTGEVGYLDQVTSNANNEPKAHVPPPTPVGL
jgi:hypothetical protein